MVQIKWICPTAPTQPISVFGGFPSTACKYICMLKAYYKKKFEIFVNSRYHFEGHLKKRKFSLLYGQNLLLEEVLLVVGNYFSNYVFVGC